MAVKNFFDRALYTCAFQVLEAFHEDASYVKRVGKPLGDARFVRLALDARLSSHDFHVIVGYWFAGHYKHALHHLVIKSPILKTTVKRLIVSQPHGPLTTVSPYTTTTKPTDKKGA